MNGDSIISYTHDLNNEYSIGLEEPMTVLLNGEHTYELTPWIPFSDGRVHVLDTMNIVIDSPVSDIMKAQYMKLVLDEITDTSELSPDTILH